MDVTTVKLHKRTKLALDELRKESESYDDLIGKLLTKSRNRNLKNELIEGYKSQGREHLRVLEEWEAASAEVGDE